MSAALLDLKVVALNRVYERVALETLVSWAIEGRIAAGDQVREVGATEWLSVLDVPELAASLPQGLHPRPRGAQPSPADSAGDAAEHEADAVTQWVARRPRRRAEEAEMDMTPMIDVTFQLLIFFMIAATYIVQKTMLLPRFEADEGAPTVTLSELARDNIVVRVARDRSVTVDGGGTTLDDLTSALIGAIQRRQHASAELILDVDDEVDHQTVVTVLDAAASAEIEQVHFVSRDTNVSRDSNVGRPPAATDSSPAGGETDFQPPALTPGQ